MADPAITIDELAARLDRLEAVEAIHRLKYRYWRACDAKDPDAMRACFVEAGASIDYGPGLGPFDDRDALVDVFVRLARRREDGQWLFHDMHHGGHPDIEILGPGRARGSWSLSFLRVNRVDGVLERAALEYRDTYVVEDGEWRIESSRVVPLTAFGVPLPDGIRVGPGVAEVAGR